MQRSRLNFHVASALLLATIAPCAGCWKKIEYHGHAAPSVKPAPVSPNTAVTSGGNPAQGDTASLPPANASDASPPKGDDDRYATAAPPATSPEAPNAVSSPQDALSAETKSSIRNPITPPLSGPASTPISPQADAPAATQPEKKPEPDDRYASAPASPNAPPSSSTPTTTPNDASTKKLASSNPPGGPPSVAPLMSASTGTNSQSSEGTTKSDPNTASASRHAAWILGSRLSLAALANDRKLAVKNVPAWFADAQAAAKKLDISVPNLPAPAAAEASAGASKQVMDYLLVNGQRIGHDLTKHDGPVESSLFEMALKSNLLLVMYKPGTPEVDSVSAALQEAAVRAKLPEDLWQPLVQAINTQAPPKEVQADIKKLHSDAEQYLAGGGLPKGQ